MAERVFQTPELDAVDLVVLRYIDELRLDLRHRVAEPRRWTGGLRRMTFARAVQGSNSIEGYNASLDDVAAAVDGEPTLDASTETLLALQGYRDAMTYVLQAAEDDDAAAADEGILKALHFMMLKHDIAKGPGRWRASDIFVHNGETNAIVYRGPDPDRVPALITAMLHDLEGSDAPVLVRAAMAHLNLVMIHPFRDGNGRMARCLQTLVLARERILAPVFSSVEEYLGRNTDDYYAVLAEVGHGAWHPEQDARPWVRFMLRAHYLQAKTLVRRIEEIERTFAGCLELASRHKLPERSAAGLMELAYGLRLRRNSYMGAVTQSTGEEISELTATRDLQAMVKADLAIPRGETRGRHYVASDETREIWQTVRASRSPKETNDPFTLAAEELQLQLTLDA